MTDLPERLKAAAVAAIEDLSPGGYGRSGQAASAHHRDRAGETAARSEAAERGWSAP